VRARRLLLALPVLLLAAGLVPYLKGGEIAVDASTYAAAGEPRRWRANLRTWPEHDTIMRALSRPRLYVLRFEGTRGGLLYFGAEHSLDPAHPQFARIRALWNEFRPTVALIEDRGGRRAWGWRGYEKTARHGEPSATLFLAHQKGVPFFSLEPAFSAQVEDELKTFSPQQVVLKEFTSWYWSRRRAGPVSDGEAGRMLGRPRPIPALAGVLITVGEVDALWRRDFAGVPTWREVGEDIAYANRGGNYLSEMSRSSNDFRDAHWLRTIVELVGKGERVFATGGASHIIRQEPVLRAELGALGLTAPGPL
jgi:hypothetical protein